MRLPLFLVSTPRAEVLKNKINIMVLTILYIKMDLENINEIIIPLYVALVCRKFRKNRVLRGKSVQGQDKSDCGCAARAHISVLKYQINQPF